MNAQAYQTYERISPPSRKEEMWRYMDFSRLPLDQVTPLKVNDQSEFPGGHIRIKSLGEGAQGHPSRVWGGHIPTKASMPEGIQAVLYEEEHDAGVLVWGNGRTWTVDLDPALKAKGVVFMDLEEALLSMPDKVKSIWGSQVKSDMDKFVAWHHAFCHGGVFVYIPKGVVLDKPLRSLYWWDQEGTALFPQTVVLVDEGAEALYIDEYVSPDMAVPGFSHSVAEVIVRPGAHLKYMNIQRWGSGVSSFLTTRARIERDAKLTSAFFALGGSVHRGDIGTNVAGEGAVSHMFGGVVGTKHQHVEHVTLQDHTAPHTTSDLLFKTALKDQARSVFSGLIHVHKKAQKSNAYQANRNLLLSGSAKADALPKLEIEADDVRCTHGATVGTLDEEQRFYLMSRGLSRDQAEQVMVDGFFSELLDRIKLAPVRDRLAQIISNKIYGS